MKKRDMTIPGDARPASVCPKCGWRCSAGGEFRSGTAPCPTVGCGGRLVLDPRACALLVAAACWPDRLWDAQWVTRKVRLPGGGAEVVEQFWRPVGVLTDALSSGLVEMDPTNAETVRWIEGIAIERGLEFLYGRFLYEELCGTVLEDGASSGWEFRHGHAGVTWARAPLDVRMRALARAFMEREAQ